MSQHNDIDETIVNNRPWPQHPRLSARPSTSLMATLASGQHKAALVFAGQGSPALPEIETLLTSSQARTWLVASRDHANLLLKNKEFSWSGAFEYGYDPLGWIENPDACPPRDYTMGTAVSQALIFTAQILRYQSLRKSGLASAMEAGSIQALTGHSQGMMAALLIGESPEGVISLPRFLDYLGYFLVQGLHMTQSFEGAPQDSAPLSSPMVAISGLNETQLQGAVSTFNTGRPEQARIYISLYNTRGRLVLSGPSPSLENLRVSLEALGAAQLKKKKKGHFAGQPLSFTWDYLEVGGAFHSPHMALGLESMLKAVEELGFEIKAESLKLPVYSPATGDLFNEITDLTHALVVTQFTQPVRWNKTLSSILQSNTSITHILDLGPGFGVARLSQSALKGKGISVLDLATNDGLHALLAHPMAPIAQSYEAWAPRPRTLINGQTVLDNAYSRATGHSPVILPGMTPTTVDVPIVAAAANQGFTAELAGGGQVTEAMFWQRMAELSNSLEPGAEIVFNALFLDPYLWDLHLGKGRLVQKAREAGYPIRGVTISAGVPDLDQAVKLLEELNALGIWHNALKPGTTAQVEQVLKIAKAVPHLPLFMHLEGGKAGGHHSWEDLDALLLQSYGKIRRQDNVILCVGGGISSPEKGQAYFTGSWADAYGEVSMPVDAILLGTLAMATLEATASPQVKEALVNAAGCEGWVFSGNNEGGMTSGKSQLGADIHYIDNAAARCGRLLDAVAGNEVAINTQREAIILALNATAKPYFGDVKDMTYGAILDRMVELMAVGRQGAYEDGLWPDASYRQRVFDFAQRTWARLGASALPESTFWTSAAILDDPKKALAVIHAALPSLAKHPIHPADVGYFIHSVCARPGKPVCFVPVIDGDVRRWYKSDSLWQAQDPRYTADQVLIIPGPEALQGLLKKDEPIAELLGRFEAHVLTHLKQTDQPEKQTLRLHPSPIKLPVGFTMTQTDSALEIHSLDPASPDALVPFLSRGPGLISALFAAPNDPRRQGNPTQPTPQDVQGSARV